MNGWNELIMEIIETISCNTKEEGLEREKELIRVHNAKININKPI
jgi:hypothetical protein